MMLWVEKYRPKDLKDVLGNSAAVRKMREWALEWSRGAPKRRALVLVGRPGVGKTSAALALANEMGWDAIELNASDLRNARGINRVLGRASRNEGFAEGRFVTSREGGRKLIIFDEADNLFGTEDRGGAGAIVSVVRSTRQPVILIVNDFYEMRRRSARLVPLVEKVTFKSISRSTVAKCLERICRSEGVTVDPPVIQDIAASTRGDLRAAINDLQSMAGGGERVSSDSVLSQRDMVSKEFDATRDILGTMSAAKAKEAYNSVDVDPEKFIFWVVENVPVAYREPEIRASAFEALSRADVFLGRARRTSFSLWSYAIVMMCGGVALAKPRYMDMPHRSLRFPVWLKMMSRSKEKRSVRSGVSAFLGGLMHTSRQRVRTELLPFYLEIMRRDREFTRYLGSLTSDGDLRRALVSLSGHDLVEEETLEKGDEPEEKKVQGPAQRSLEHFKG